MQVPLPARGAYEHRGLRLGDAVDPRPQRQRAPDVEIPLLLGNPTAPQAALQTSGMNGVGVERGSYASSLTRRKISDQPNIPLVETNLVPFLIRL